MSQSTTAGTQAPGFCTFKLGAFEMIALHEGVLIRDMPPGFVPDASDAEVAEAYAAAGMARDKLTITFNPLAVRGPEGVVLIDTGLGEFGPPGTGQLLGNLAAAGIRPEEVTSVIISHFHADHILGLNRKAGGLTFPKAKIFVPAKEWAYWMDEANKASAPAAAQDNFGLCQQVFGKLADQVALYEWETEVLPGFTSVRANGHTPGMSAIRIASGGEAMMYVADITNNPLVFLRHPDWVAAFDMDPAETIATRRRILDQAVAEKLRVSFYHAPFPATGYIARNSDGYEFLPALWRAV